MLPRPLSLAPQASPLYPPNLYTVPTPSPTLRQAQEDQEVKRTYAAYLEVQRKYAATLQAAIGKPEVRGCSDLRSDSAEAKPAKDAKEREAAEFGGWVPEQKGLTLRIVPCHSWRLWESGFVGMNVAL